MAFIEATFLEHLPNIECSGRRYYLSHATYLFLVPETWSQAKTYIVVRINGKQVFFEFYCGGLRYQAWIVEIYIVKLLDRSGKKAPTFRIFFSLLIRRDIENTMNPFIIG